MSGIQNIIARETTTDRDRERGRLNQHSDVVNRECWLRPTGSSPGAQNSTPTSAIFSSPRRVRPWCRLRRLEELSTRVAEQLDASRARAKLARNSSSGAPMRLSCFVRKRTAVYKSTDGAETRGFGGDVDRGLGGCSRGSSTVWKPASRSREQPGAPVGVDVVDGLADEVLWFVVHEGVSFRRILRTGSRARWACPNLYALSRRGRGRRTSRSAGGANTLRFRR